MSNYDREIELGRVSGGHDEWMDAQDARRKASRQASNDYIKANGTREGRYHYLGHAVKGRSNVKGTCLWCGGSLRPYRQPDAEDPESLGRVGDYGDVLAYVERITQG